MEVPSVSQLKRNLPVEVSCLVVPTRFSVHYILCLSPDVIIEYLNLHLFPFQAKLCDHYYQD
jgi:hypothetical protein